MLLLRSPPNFNSNSTSLTPAPAYRQRTSPSQAGSFNIGKMDPAIYESLEEALSSNKVIDLMLRGKAIRSFVKKSLAVKARGE